MDLSPFLFFPFLFFRPEQALARGPYASEVVVREAEWKTRTLTPYRDPRRPPYNNGKVHLDHEEARCWGNQGPATRELPAETNLRRGGHDGHLRDQEREYLERLAKEGYTSEQAGRNARAYVQGEIDANRNSPPPRPMPNEVLDDLLSNPFDQ